VSLSCCLALLLAVLLAMQTWETSLKLESILHGPASQNILASNSTNPETFNYQLPALAAFLVDIVLLERQGHVPLYFRTLQVQ